MTYFSPPVALQIKPSLFSSILAYHNDRWKGYASYKAALQGDRPGVSEYDEGFTLTFGDHENCEQRQMATLNGNLNKIRMRYDIALNHFADVHEGNKKLPYAYDIEDHIYGAKQHVADFFAHMLAKPITVNSVDGWIDFIGPLYDNYQNKLGHSQIAGDVVGFAFQAAVFEAILPHLEKAFGHDAGEGLTEENIQWLADHKDTWDNVAEYKNYFGTGQNPLDYRDVVTLQAAINFASVLTAVDNRVADYNDWTRSHPGNGTAESLFHFISSKGGNPESINQTDIANLLESSLSNNFFATNAWSIANMEVYIDKREKMAINV